MRLKFWNGTGIGNLHGRDGREIPSVLGVWERVVGSVGHRLPLALQRIRWDRVALIGFLVVVPVVLTSGTASGHGLAHAVVREDFIGPRVRVGYSPITNEERKEMALEEIRKDKIAHGEPVDEPEENTPLEEQVFLDSADKERQHDGDLDFSKANRDSLVLRAVGSWKRPHWLSDVDWERVSRNLAIESGEWHENWNPIEDDDRPDETISGYDDVARLSFSDGIGLTWTTPSDGSLEYDGDKGISGNLPVCLDTKESVMEESHAVYALDHAGDDGIDLIKLDEKNDDYESIYFTDEVVPKSSKWSMMLGSASGYSLRTVSVNRRGYEIEVTRAERDEEDDGILHAGMTALGPKGRLSNEVVSGYATSKANTNIKMKASYDGVTVSTTDERGLRGVTVKLRFTISGKIYKSSETIDSDDSKVSFHIEDYLN